ncbi:cobalamin biosynthesis protein [Advenella kashmirensis W13003]|uniref:Cobalamin biosynthesis protein n=1 Tax=Advenella kashmirensis W13003 TaxID=1424334 RepID=V8QY12_9BURK|nr:CobW family GTP-binding protein [Advenella kashmirensis]ETF04205.1 cobalamin biosynthesis protein [Advenella kashmirensis W13003]
MKQPIALTVLGGFLGAGKTTVLNYLLQAPHGLRLMVLVNDFGAVNVDATLIESVSGDGVVSLRNGCVCCSMGGELMNALMAIEKRGDCLDGLVIEGSGVSDPRKIAQIGALGQGFALQSVITVVDAASVLSQREDRYVGDMVKRQIVGAHVILLNKTDLVDTAHGAEVLSWLHDMAPGVPVFAGSRGRYDWEVLLAPPVQTSEAPTSRMSSSWTMGRPNGSEHFESSPVFQSYCFENAGAFDEQRLRDIFAGLHESVLRAKGIVHVGPDKRICVLHYVRGHVLTLDVSNQRYAGSSLIFVGTPDFAQAPLAEALELALLK